MIIKEATDIAESSTGALKNVGDFLYSIKQLIKTPIGLDKVVLDGYAEIIKSVTSNDNYDENFKMYFVSTFKQKVKEHRNCAKIIDFAKPNITDIETDRSPDEDWFSFFFDKARLVSNEGIQNLWGKVLAGEINQPNCFSFSFMNTLSIINTKDAELFCNLARFCMYDENYELAHPFIFVAKNVHTYANSGITRDQLLSLQRLGLINCDFKDEFIFLDQRIFKYGNRLVEVIGDPKNENKISVGNVIFTSDGIALYHLIGEEFKEYNNLILEYTIEKLRSRGCKVTISS
jgi:hypothetical protein